MASLFTPSVDYTAKDFQALRLRIQGLIRSVFPDWTEFAIANFANILLESFCHIGDIATFYQDSQARDLYWPTVRQRSNAIKLGRGINFRLTSAVSSTSTVKFSLPSVAAKQVIIPWGTKLRTPGTNAVSFRTTAATTIEIGQQNTTVAVEQAIAVGYRDPVSEEVTEEESFVSTEGPSQKYRTLRAPVIDDTVDVEAEDGTYTEVSSFLDNDPDTGETIDENSKVFVTLNDANGYAIVVFGNGISGKIPIGTTKVVYKIGGGAEGNVDVGQITVIDNTIYYSDGAIAPVTVTNTIAASGGSNRMSVLQARSRGPQSLRTLERSVSKEDFEYNARRISGVARACMVTSNELSVVPENSGYLYIVAKGATLTSGRIASATPTSSLLTTVYNSIISSYPPPITFTLETKAAVFKTINVFTRIYRESGTDADDVGDAIRESLYDFFAAQLSTGLDNPDIDFGANIKQADGTVISEIAWSDIFNQINDTEGVRKVDEGTSGLLLNLRRQSISLEAKEFPALGTISIVDADDGSSL
jgi:hypothetical protein